jgi:glycosyltransferase involved in cell wall biosynthesis
MNLWTKHVTKTRVIAPLIDGEPRKIDSEYASKSIEIQTIPTINFVGLSNKLSSIFKVPLILLTIVKHCFWADHIHLRCPGNIGLLGSLVQFFFPSKIKTVKYAGNWDPNSNQPLSYRIQQKILSNTFFTKNCKVLVYGEWPNTTKNIHPFFTASYFSNEIERINKIDIKQKLQLIYVGGLTANKQPLLSVKVAHELKKRGFPVELNVYGDGAERKNLEDYIRINSLKDVVFLRGNQKKETVKKAFQKAHFLIFVSKSEGWPKVVAEAMFWGSIPIASAVSCVPYMLDHGARGTLVKNKVLDVVAAVEHYTNNPTFMLETSEKGITWSQGITLDKFEKEIKKIIQSK